MKSCMFSDISNSKKKKTWEEKNEMRTKIKKYRSVDKKMKKKMKN